MDVARPKVGPGPIDASAQLTRRVVTVAPSADLTTVLGAGAVTRGIAPTEILDIDARGHLMRALELEPTAVRARVLLFLLELRDQRYVEAEQLVDGLVREYPDDPDHLALYAEFELRLADLPKAKEFAERALRIDPRHVDALRIEDVLDVVSGQRDADPHASAQRLARLLERFPDAEPVLVTLFQTLVQHHQLQEAMRLGYALLGAQTHNVALRNALIRDLATVEHPLGASLYQLRRGGWVRFVILAFVVGAVCIVVR